MRHQLRGLGTLQHTQKKKGFRSRSLSRPYTVEHFCSCEKARGKLHPQGSSPQAVSHLFLRKPKEMLAGGV